MVPANAGLRPAALVRKNVIVQGVPVLAGNKDGADLP